MSLVRFRAIAWMMWVTASVFYAYQYVLRVMPNILFTEIVQRFHIDASAFGQFSGVYYIGYSLMHLPLGLLLDRFGPRKIMGISLLLTVSGLFPLLFASSWIFPVMGRLLIGMGSSAAILSLFTIIRKSFKKEQFPRLLSISVMIGLVGAIYGGGPVHYMLQSLGYNAVIYVFAATGIALTLVAFCIMPNERSVSQNTVLFDLKEVFSNPKIFWICILAGLMVGPLEGFADVWGSVFLRVVCHLDAGAAASVPSVIFIGMCFGAPVLNFIAERIHNYFLTITLAGIAMAVCFALLISGFSSVTFLSAIFALVGMCSSYQILAIYKTSTYARDSTAGLTTAVANMIIMIFGYVFHTAIGAIVAALGGPTSAQALTYGISVIPAALFVGSAGFLLLFFYEKKGQQTAAVNVKN